MRTPKTFGSFKTPAPPTLVAEKILEITESNTWKLRHPVGTDSEPFIQWRASMSAEKWINCNRASNKVWYKSVEQDFGLNAS